MIVYDTKVFRMELWTSSLRGTLRRTAPHQAVSDAMTEVMTVVVTGMTADLEDVVVVDEVEAGEEDMMMVDMTVKMIGTVIEAEVDTKMTMVDVVDAEDVEVAMEVAMETGTIAEAVEDMGDHLGLLDLRLLHLLLI